ncbi:hypothetical protein AVEN_247587-1 [Araneus ventricosus]|uniref:Uncharacterized protein n=1 Tax=Araneus ventricosus TaxID=182803 RepID=A0A4Y2DAA5_ARAVE|nr:hypothetical protein AVEN_247587-1 [Araneus ventricosus]
MRSKRMLNAWFHCGTNEGERVKRDIHRCSTPRFSEHGKAKAFFNVKSYENWLRQTAKLSRQLICTLFHSICPKTVFFSPPIQVEKIRQVIHLRLEICSTTRFSIPLFLPTTRRISDFLASSRHLNQGRFHLGNMATNFGDEKWYLKGDRIFSISLLGEKIRLNILNDSM